MNRRGSIVVFGGGEIISQPLWVYKKLADWPLLFNGDMVIMDLAKVP